MAKTHDRRRLGAPMMVAAVIAVTVALGAVALAMSAGYQIGSLSRPGPGLWPAALAVVLMMLCVGLLLVPGLAASGASPTMSRQQWSRLASAVAPLLVFVPVMMLLGSSLATGLLAMYWLVAVYRRSLRYSAIWAVVFAVALQLVFVQGLNVPLPGGLLFGGDGA